MLHESKRRSIKSFNMHATLAGIIPRSSVQRFETACPATNAESKIGKMGSFMINAP